MAARDDEGCHLWLIREVHHAGIVKQGDLDFDPCAEWPGALVLGRDPLPGSLDLEVTANDVIVIGADGERTLASGRAHTYVAATANPTADQVAVLRRDPVEVEVWGLDGQAAPITLGIPTSDRAWSSVELVWGERGLFIVLTRASDGDPPRVEVWLWRNFDEPPREVSWYAGDDEGRASTAYVDPQLRWLWFVESAQTSGVDIHSSDAGFRDSPLWWRAAITPPISPETGDGYSGWTVGPGTAWVDVNHTRREGDKEFDYHDMHWHVAMLAPLMYRSEVANIGRQLRAHEWQWLGVEDGWLRLDETVCEPAWGTGGKLPPCSVADVPKGCEVLDRPTLPPGRPGVRASWISCTSGRHAGKAGLWSWSGDTMRALGTSRRGDAVTLIWASEGVATWTRDRGLTLVDAQLQDVFVDPDADAILRAPLDAELGLVLVQSGASLQTMAIRDGGIQTSIVAPPPDWAAFHPSGDRLALAWSSEIALFDRQTSSELARWDTPTPVAGLAWRQDGQVLFSGHERAVPELAWSAKDGARVPASDPSPGLTECLLHGQIDPSWRWCKAGSSFMRVSDGAWLVGYGTGSAVASNGRHEVDEGHSWHGVQWWALRPRDDVLGELVPLDLVDEFREPTAAPFAAGASMGPLELDRGRWQELVACAERQHGMFAPRSCREAP